MNLRLIAAAGFGLVLIGCGTTQAQPVYLVAPPTAPPTATATVAPTPAATQPVSDAVRNYIRATLDDNGNGNAACALLTADAAQAFVDKVKLQTNTTDCATAFEAEAATMTDDEKAVYRSAVLKGVTINGDKAIVTVQFTGVSKDISLQKVGGDWKISTGPTR